MFTGRRLLLHFKQMAQPKKRPLASEENLTAPVVALKQTKLNFGGGNQLTLEKSPYKSMKKPDPNGFFARAIAPLQGSSWMTKIGKELDSPYMQAVFKQLGDEAKNKKVIFPPIDLIFNAFVLSPFGKIKVVILGQDPYHGDGQAHGLSFSVPPGISQPPSLKNIFKELAKEYPGFKIPEHGSLIKWAEQGVFLLNATLTVEKSKANSHREFGWQKFTDFVIRKISQERTGIVFVLWGNFAHKKSELIDKSKHAIIKAAHPSPLSYGMFTGCKCFTKTNEALTQMGKEPIAWGNL